MCYLHHLLLYLISSTLVVNLSNNLHTQYIHDDSIYSIWLSVILECGTIISPCFANKRLTFLIIKCTTNGGEPTYDDYVF